MQQNVTVTDCDGQTTPVAGMKGKSDFCCSYARDGFGAWRGVCVRRQGWLREHLKKAQSCRRSSEQVAAESLWLGLSKSRMSSLLEASAIWYAATCVRSKDNDVRKGSVSGSLPKEAGAYSASNA